MSGSRQAKITVRYLGGPTAVLQLGGLTVVTDPTFDPPGEHPVGQRTLHKTMPAALAPEQLGAIDLVLLSHDQHPDNLDNLGREVAAAAPLVLSTQQAAQRLGGSVRGLQPWSSHDLRLPEDGSVLRITAVPARHGPPGCEPYTGEVVGFVLSGDAVPTVYVSGDNAALEHVRAVHERFPEVDLALLFAGGARTALLDGAYLTFTSEQAARAAALLGARRVIPLHFEGWAHFTDGRDRIRPAFAAAGLADRLTLLDVGESAAG